MGELERRRVEISAFHASRHLIPSPFDEELIRYAGHRITDGALAAVTHVLALRMPGGDASPLYDRRVQRRLEACGAEVTEFECAGVPQDGELERVMDYLLVRAGQGHATDPPADGSPRRPRLPT